MSRIIDAGLEELSATLNKMGELAYRAVLAAIMECIENRQAYNEIREMSNALVSMADNIEDKAFELIARFQPVASDLRTIKSYMKIAYDFARFGRYALDMSYINQKFGGIRNCNAWIVLHIKGMSEKTLEMMSLSITALRSHNPQLAEKAAQSEKEIDKMYFDFLDKLVEKAGAATTKCIISNVLIVRYLERIADHATYICESIIYIATGRRVILR
ncbi:MAG: phosphate signaling complex protein PhoU [Candidatus Bathyarchaeota archaeon]|nr:phosphate signaling complex protein PhoU [Candidatus Bathyarchaeota archaeon]MCX8176693.1 phosphate signaling complex protein PhoU [Candidatus Bathyarchaeota archaeon]MDW8193221.1 phosphate signaling complex protein PhoU [Nitrososphaerota archaeon]